MWLRNWLGIKVCIILRFGLGFVYEDSACLFAWILSNYLRDWDVTSSEVFSSTSRQAANDISLNSHGKQA